MKHTIQGFQPIGDTDEQAEAAARAHMRDHIRTQSRVMIGDSLQRGEAVAIRLSEDGSDYTTWDGDGQPDGYIVTWTAESGDRVQENPEPVGEITDKGETADGRPYVVIAMPPAVTEIGGGFRIQHDLAGEVTVTMFKADGSGIGYLFVQPITDDVSHVEAFAGVATIRVERDPEEPEPEGEVIH